MISGLGSCLTTAAFAAIFWNLDNNDKKVGLTMDFVIFESQRVENLIYFQFAVSGSTVLGSILSSNILLVSCLILYFLSFNIGFGPVKFTLLSEMFTPTDQVKSFSRSWVNHSRLSQHVCPLLTWSLVPHLKTKLMKSTSSDSVGLVNFT